MKSKENQKKQLHCLAECAIMVAMSIVLSFVKIWEMPLGGSITLLSMLPVMLISVRWGIGPGLTSAFVYALSQLFIGMPELMSWGMTPFMWCGSVLFDYLIAFSLLGLAGIFRKKGIPGVMAGIVMVCVLRFLSHFISGAIFFAVWCPEGWNALWYSVCYNGGYMLPELVITVIGASLLVSAKPIRRLLGI